MRDLETIAIAMETAETGHLVFGTLHTSTRPRPWTASSTSSPPTGRTQIRTMLADALNGVIAADAVPRRSAAGRRPPSRSWSVNVAVANLIREGKTFQIPSMMQTGRSFGMRMMNDCLSELVENGAVTVEEALAKAIDKEALRGRLRSRGLLAA